jgi:hypothetical protein
MNLTKKIAVVIASSAMLLNTALPAFAATTEIIISGNGADSSNTAGVTVSNSTQVSQTNTSNIVNNVSANSNTGGNEANKNTGGSVSVDTGNAKTVVGVSNTTGSNVADVQNCNCSTDALVEISGNGAESKNTTGLKLTDKVVVAQKNDSDVFNHVDADAKTGSNEANKNTGGSVEISTGNALTKVELSTTAGSNIAQVGGGNQGAGSVALKILGNGADSKNEIALNLDRDVLLQQSNISDVSNWIGADAKTGGNKAGKNTGGTVSIDTGNAVAGAFVDNSVGFNWADVGCDCLGDVTAKIAGNGASDEWGNKTDNKIKATLSNDVNIWQDNSCKEFDPWWFDFWYQKGCLNNSLDVNANTGTNEDKKNTGNPGVDPSVTTGDAESITKVENTGGSNIYGAPVESPNPGNGVNVNITFDLRGLLEALGILHS